MLTIAVLAISMCLPFVAYHFVSDKREWNGFKSFLFDAMMSLFLAVFVSALLILCIIMPASGSAMTEPAVEDTYSGDLSMRARNRTIYLEIGDESLSFPRSSVTLQTSSDNPEIQEKLAQGQSVAEVYVQVSEATLVEKRECVLYAAGDVAQKMAEALLTDDDDGEEDE